MAGGRRQRQPDRPAAGSAVPIRTLTVNGQDQGTALPGSGACGITTRDRTGRCPDGDLGQLVSDSLPSGLFGALLRACRHRACLSQEQLAALADLSERTVRNLEAGQVRSPRTHTVRLLADALALTG